MYVQHVLHSQANCFQELPKIIRHLHMNASYFSECLEYVVYAVGTSFTNLTDPEMLQLFYGGGP